MVHNTLSGADYVCFYLKVYLTFVYVQGLYVMFCKVQHLHRLDLYTRELNELRRWENYKPLVSQSFLDRCIISGCQYDIVKFSHSSFRDTIPLYIPNPIN